MVVGHCRLEVGVGGEIDGGEGDVPQETGLSSLETQCEAKHHQRVSVTKRRWRRLAEYTGTYFYLVESKEAQVSHHVERANSRPGGDLACHLQTDFHYLQRVSKDHLGASSLQEPRQQELVSTIALPLLHGCLMARDATYTAASHDLCEERD